MTASPRPRILTYQEEEIRAAVTDADALAGAEAAFRALAGNAVTLPPPVGLDIPAVRGEVHVKGAYVQGAPVFAFKVASGFYANTGRGLPSGSGLVLVFDAQTGFPLGLLADNGYLTDLRTAAAGALAVRHLAAERPLEVAVLGTGVQGRMQLRLMRRVREFSRVRAWSPSPDRRHAFAEEASRELGVPVTAVESPEGAVAGADLVVTATPSREPLVQAEWLSPGVTVVALGSDGPEKQELHPRVLVTADKVVTDLTTQCVRLGELHHAVAAGAMEAADVYGELGPIVAGDLPGRESAHEIIVCDLTGVGVQDAAIAERAWMALTRTP
ncbi:MAG: ornithine cyclodeaminase family protein [Gemmatimonadota bacterium]|nr:ornithine cyclodeaminase family protein [Gemmatimonadota bacterium]MDH5759440.1 ornithine cyclodeaminase family protein [Gemmatimonadota bacterium]